MLIPCVDTFPELKGTSAEERKDFKYLRSEVYLSYLPLGERRGRFCSKRAAPVLPLCCLCDPVPPPFTLPSHPQRTSWSDAYCGVSSQSWAPSVSHSVAPANPWGSLPAFPLQPSFSSVPVSRSGRWAPNVTLSLARPVH